MLCASLVTSAGNWASAVSKITCRARASAVREIALRLTITTSAQDGSAASARTAAAPTCPVPPMIKTRNSILSPPPGSPRRCSGPRCAKDEQLHAGGRSELGRFRRGEMAVVEGHSGIAFEKGCFDHHEVRLPDVLGQAVGRFCVAHDDELPAPFGRP